MRVVSGQTEDCICRLVLSTTLFSLFADLTFNATQTQSQPSQLNFGFQFSTLYYLWAVQKRRSFD